MSFISSVIIPEIERQLLKATPEITAYLLKNAASVAGDFITYLENRFTAHAKTEPKKEAKK
jgi:hypothetical protein